MLIIIGSIILGFVLLILFEVFIATLGENEIYKNPERTPRTFGSSSGQELKYLVMGDSTAAGQGAPYEEGFAIKTSAHLAERYKVTMVNTGVSGAKIEEILADQVPFVEKFKPDIVLISMSANDTVRLTSLEKIRSGLREEKQHILAFKYRTLLQWKISMAISHLCSRFLQNYLHIILMK